MNRIDDSAGRRAIDGPRGTGLTRRGPSGTGPYQPEPLVLVASVDQEPAGSMVRPRRPRRRTYASWSPFALLMGLIALAGGLYGFATVLRSTPDTAIIWLAVVLGAPEVAFMGWIMLMLALEELDALITRRLVRKA